MDSCFQPPQDTTFVTQVDDLTDDVDKAKNFIDLAAASGGGDGPECICCALHDCLNKLTWRNEAVKVAVLISDAPPHGLGTGGDGFPNGCPDHNDPVDIVHKMAEKGITLYCAGCEPSLKPYRQFFIALTLITGGQYVPLGDAENLAKVIIGGSREEISTEKLMAQVHQEVIKEAAEKGTRVDEDELTRRIHNILNSQGSKINKIDGIPEIEISDEVKQLSKEKTLTSMVDFAKNNKIKLNSFSAFPSLGSTFSWPRSHLPTKGSPVTIRAPVVKRVRPIKRTTPKKTAPARSPTVKRLALTFTQTRYNLRTRTAVSYTVFYKLRPSVDTPVTPAVSPAPKTGAISMIQTRRMVKKSLARNKLN